MKAILSFIVGLILFVFGMIIITKGEQVSGSIMLSSGFVGMGLFFYLERNSDTNHKP